MTGRHRQSFTPGISRSDCSGLCFLATPSSHFLPLLQAVVAAGLQPCWRLQAFRRPGKRGSPRPGAQQPCLREGRPEALRDGRQAGARTRRRRRGRCRGLAALRGPDRAAASRPSRRRPQHRPAAAGRVGAALSARRKFQALVQSGMRNHVAVGCCQRITDPSPAPTRWRRTLGVWLPEPRNSSRRGIGDRRTGPAAIAPATAGQEVYDQWRERSSPRVVKELRLSLSSASGAGWDAAAGETLGRALGAKPPASPGSFGHRLPPSPEEGVAVRGDQAIGEGPLECSNWPLGILVMPGTSAPAQLPPSLRQAPISSRN